jgi:cell division protein FtsQ
MTDTLVPPEVESPEEPRLRARRVEVRRAERRRRRRLLAAVIAVVVLAGAAVGTLYSPLFDVDHLDIEGVRHLDPATVAKASGLRVGQQLIDLDTTTAEHALARVSWVRRVTVTRRWPDTVEIRIGERTGVAIAAVGGDRLLVVTADGVVAGPAGPLDASLHAVTVDPAVHVAVGRPLPARVAGAIEMVGALPEPIASNATGSSVTASGEVAVSLRGGATLKLGNSDDVDQKFIAAQSLLGGSVVLSCLRTADVSVPSAPVIERAPGC